MRSIYFTRGRYHRPPSPREVEYLHEYPTYRGKLNGFQAIGGVATNLLKENGAVQVLHVVLDAHEVVPHAQYDDDDIGYAVPELCSQQTSQQQQAVSSCL